MCVRLGSRCIFFFVFVFVFSTISGVVVFTFIMMICIKWIYTLYILLSRRQIQIKRKERARKREAYDYLQTHRSIKDWRKKYIHSCIYIRVQFCILSAYFGSIKFRKKRTDERISTYETLPRSKEIRWTHNQRKINYNNIIAVPLT